MDGILVSEAVADKIKSKYCDAVFPRKLTEIDNKEKLLGQYFTYVFYLANHFIKTITVVLTVKY
jgi:hypothetical protein